MRTLLVLLILLAPAAGDGPSNPLGAGWSTLKMGEEEIEVYRDFWGIPHIFAKSVAGAFWAEGYTEAEDRLWQMETFRRGAKGQSAEIFGEKAAPNDLNRRRAGYTDAELQKMFDASSERMRMIVTAYTAGVNAFLKTGRLPPEYAEHKHEPRPWGETDCVAIGVMMARRFGEAGDVELMVEAVFTQLEKRFGKDKAQTILRDLLRDSDPLAPTTLNDHERGPAKRGDHKHNFRGINLDWYAATIREHEEARAAAEALGLPTYFGSNAWVVGPKKSASGRAILYGGPMMGFGTPSICNEIHLVAPGLNVAGMSFPGVPGVMIGFNEKIAWTTTSCGADLVDVYTLELNPDNPDEYRHAGAWRKFETFETEIRIAGSETRRETVRRSRYGPMSGTIDAKNRRAHTQAMSFWMKEQMTFEAVMDFNFATSIEEFRKSVGKIVTSHNFFVADSDGHIGFWYCGAHPRRKKEHDPRLPQKGDGSMDWGGLLLFEEWPQSVDPPHGFFANWNNKPARAWDPSGFGKILWGRKIFDVLERDGKLTFEQVESIARETAYDDFLAAHFLPHILAAVKNDAALAERFSKYDCAKRDGDARPAIVEKWFKGMLARVFGDEFGPILLQDRTMQRILMDPLLYLLDGNGMIKYDFLGGADAKAMAAEALKDAMKDEKLAWNDEQVDFKGKAGKVKSQRGRGTFQMTVECSKDGPRATTLAAPGQSENLDSPHCADQVDLFGQWKYKPFVFRRAEMK